MQSKRERKEADLLTRAVVNALEVLVSVSAC